MLYSYWRSSCSHRVRIALNSRVLLCPSLRLEYEYKAVNLVKGEQFSPDFEKLNPSKFVPVLVDEGAVIADSFAIILYLEEKYPQHPLLPRDLLKKTINYQVANIVFSGIQPFRILIRLMVFIHPQNYIEELSNADKRLEWARHHVETGFEALEKLLERHAGKYATGDEIFLADVFLAPQLYAGAFDCSIFSGNSQGRYPILARLMSAYDEIPAFQAARPEVQPDCPPSA
ncbi:unnamed protein product [Spirodela intermedia]|uniref:glutathione transferase n=1 Tax=Spirodela intermedia TaxID=51605 RepID=A0A7I8JFG1_SPIIN|nr:unnamed protein product [Spirodela intermedia]CAA6668273.1 unnamed protein product [Spirodela intermedia]